MRPSPTPCSGASPRRPRRSGSTTLRSSPAGPRSRARVSTWPDSRSSAVAAVRARAVAVPAWLWLAGIVARLDRRADRARAPDGRALDHGRRDRLLRAREVVRDARSVPRARRAVTRLRLRLPGADRAGLAALRRRARRIRRREGDQRGADVARGDPRVLPRPAPPAGDARPGRRRRSRCSCRRCSTRAC